MSEQISNMNYYFNKQYFHGLKVGTMGKEGLAISVEGESFERRNQKITAFPFQLKDGSSRPSEIPGVRSFQLTTLYPGLLIGTGYAHDLKSDDAIKCGFSFDYVSGLPYLPGSSLKGMLRSFFPNPEGADPEVEENKRSYIEELLKKFPSCVGDIDIDELAKAIFEGEVVFLDVFPAKDNYSTLLDFEYITPHKGEFSSPIPIQLIKVKPNVSFDFSFLLKDDLSVHGTAHITANTLVSVFRQMILDMGVGAKTNVGFGKFKEGGCVKTPARTPARTTAERNSRDKNSREKERSTTYQKHICKNEGCNNPTTMKSDGTYWPFCKSCASKYKKQEQNHAKRI